MLEFSPKSAWSSSYHFRTPGHELVEVQASPWRQSAVFVVQAQRYRLSREKGWRGDFRLEREDGTVLGHAIKPSRWRDRYQLVLDGRDFLMKRRSAWKREFVIVEDDREVGVVRPAGAFSRRAWVDLPADWAIPHQVLVFWLALLSWRAQAAAAAAG